MQGAAPETDPSDAVARRLMSVVVLYRPVESTWRTAAQLVANGYRPIFVINDALPDDEERVRELGAADWISFSSNVGLAAALNAGAERAFALNADYLMLLDQDSEPDRALGPALCRLAAAFGPLLAAIGPRPIDRKRPAARTVRTQTTLSPAIGSVATIISSGTVIPRAAFERVGPMWEPLFIDAIDHEWCLRARALGFEIAVAQDLEMLHDMGDGGFALLGRYKPIHRSPLRHFHIVRNTLWLARLSFIPRRWRVREVIKLAVRAPAYLMFSSDRAATLRCLAAAVRDGWRGGPVPDHLREVTRLTRAT